MSKAKSKAISREDAKAQRKAKTESRFAPFFATIEISLSAYTLPQGEAGLRVGHCRKSRLCAKNDFAFAVEI
jgi:hypothetical protein